MSEFHFSQNWVICLIGYTQASCLVLVLITLKQSMHFKEYVSSEVRSQIADQGCFLLAQLPWFLQF